MPSLLYCITKSSVRLNESQPGVAGSAVSRIDEGNTAAFISRAPDSKVWLQAPLRISAMELHRVLMKLFDLGPIVPFRFPTIFADDAALADHLREHSPKYSVQLDKFEKFVQMEARIVSVQQAAAAVCSGREYLQVRQRRNRALADVACAIQRAAAAADWRQRATRDGMRCFALVQRPQITEFRVRMTKLDVPPELSVRVSGPWPVAEFLEDAKAGN